MRYALVSLWADSVEMIKWNILFIVIRRAHEPNHHAEILSVRNSHICTSAFACHNDIGDE